MRVLLINPHRKHSIKAEIPFWISESVGAFPPLGLMYIASYLRKHGNHTVAILDSVAAKSDSREILKYIKKFDPGMVGLTTHTNALMDVISLVRDIKRVYPHIHVSLGGAHANIYPKESCEIQGVDTVVVGEGEKTFLNLVDTVQSHGDLSAVRGIRFIQNGQIFDTGPAEIVEDLDSLPFPARDLIDKEHYYYLVGKKAIITTISSSRGCPYSCSFCSTPKEKYRVRSIGNVVDEMEECARGGLQEVHFIDDTFNVERERTLSLCTEIMRRGLRLRWSVRTRINNLDREVIQHMKKSGCWRINLGVETSTNEGLDILNKGISVEEVKEKFQLCHDLGMKTVAYFLIGCPHEKNNSDIQRMIDFTKEIDADFAVFSILTLYPFTPLYQEALKKGLLKEDVWAKFVQNPREDFIAPIWNEHFSRDELSRLLNQAYRKFYLRGKVLLRNLKNTQNSKTVLRRLQSLFKVVFCSDA